MTKFNMNNTIKNKKIIFSHERQNRNHQKISRRACSYPKWLALTNEGIQNIDFTGMSNWSWCMDLKVQSVNNVWICNHVQHWWRWTAMFEVLIQLQQQDTAWLRSLIAYHAKQRPKPRNHTINALNIDDPVKWQKWLSILPARETSKVYYSLALSTNERMI